MAYICGLKQRIYAELFDTLFQGVGNVAVTPTTQMFMRQSAGNHLTNMTGQGQLASDNTFVILAMAATDIFITLRNTGFPTPIAHATTTAQTVEDIQWNLEMYQLIRKQLLLTLMVGEKPEVQGHFDAFPAAQGLGGSAVSVSSSGTSANNDFAQLITNNGEPSFDSLLRLAKPAIISPRQQFNVIAQFAAQATVNATAAPDVQLYLNAASPTALILDYKSCVVRLLGTLLRHVL